MRAGMRQTREGEEAGQELRSEVFLLSFARSPRRARDLAVGSNPAQAKKSLLERVGFALRDSVVCVINRTAVRSLGALRQPRDDVRFVIAPAKRIFADE